MVAVVYLLAFLMVSNIKYPALKRFEFKKRVSFTRFLFVILLLYVFATLPRIALFILSFIYVVVGPIGLLLPRRDQQQEPQEDIPNHQI